MQPSQSTRQDYGWLKQVIAKEGSGGQDGLHTLSATPSTQQRSRGDQTRGILNTIISTG